MGSEMCIRDRERYAFASGMRCDAMRCDAMRCDGTSVVFYRNEFANGIYGIQCDGMIRDAMPAFRLLHFILCPAGGSSSEAAGPKGRGVQGERIGSRRAEEGAHIGRRTPPSQGKSYVGAIDG